MISRVLFTIVVVGTWAVMTTGSSLCLYRIWTRDVDFVAYIWNKATSWIPEKVHRELNLAELANTTKLQEAILIDSYRFAQKPPVDPVNEWNTRTSEVSKLIDPILQDYTRIGEILSLDFGSAFDDLLKRDMYSLGKLAELQVTERTKVVGNTFLSVRGTELAKDLIYLRAHPEIKVPRPIE